MITSILQRNIVPDMLIRIGIRHLLRARLAEMASGSLEEVQARFTRLINHLKDSPIAVNTLEANQQHYEVPAAFYEKVLGKHLKYSCGWWEEHTKDLSQAEEQMLSLTCERAALEDGQDVLELGCGWGSLTLYMAARYPNSQIVAVSNSHSQRAFIEARCQERNLANVRVITTDINEFSIKGSFDRVVSVEMFEHMRNYSLLLDKIHGCLRPDGQLFVHIFVHKEYAYLFEVRDETDWMAKYFFTGGIMPSDHLLLYFADRFEVSQHWRINGLHYAKTARAWLENMDRHRNELKPLFEDVYGQDAEQWWSWWRIFFMACEELWTYRGGNEWFVSHYRFRKPG